MNFLVSSKDELGKLYVKARCYAEGHQYSGMNRYEFIYRCKNRDYFEKVSKNEDMMMFPYVKDNNGHPTNPMNGRINGRLNR